MMHYWLTEKSVLHCLHPAAGKVDLKVTQSFVKISGGRVSIQANTLKRPISGCKHPASTNSKPCTLTLSVSTGYSRFIRINGKPVCLGTVNGVTDSVPPSKYQVTRPGQNFVRGI